MNNIRALTVIEGLGFAGGESRILSMGQGLEQGRFTHSVLTLNSWCYSAPQFQARRAEYLKAGVTVNDLTDLVPEQPLQFDGLTRGPYSKTGILRRARRLARLLRQWKVNVIDSHLADGVLTDSRIRSNQMGALVSSQKGKFRVIPNGIPTPRSERTTAEMRATLGLPQDPEGMSLGKPAVVTSAGGIPEIVQDGETGLVVPPGDADALANGLLRMLGEPELARWLGEGPRRRYEARYQPATMARALEECFSELAR